MSTSVVTTPSVVTAAKAAVLPRVNLLPPEIAEARRLRQLQMGLAAGVAGALGVIALAYLGAQSSVSSAGHDLARSNAALAAVQTQVNQESGVTQKYALVDAAKALRSTALGREVTWSTYLHDLGLNIPDNVWITTMTVAEQVDSTPAALSATTVLRPGDGTVTFQGVAYSRNDVASWLDSLAKEKGYRDPYFTTAAETSLGQRVVVNFTSTVTLTDDAFSGRYTKTEN